MRSALAALLVLLAALLAPAMAGAQSRAELPGMPPPPPALEELIERRLDVPKAQRDLPATEQELEALLERMQGDRTVADQVVVLAWLALIRIGRDDLAGAVRALDSAIGLDTGYWFLRQTRGGTLQRLGKSQAALTDLNFAYRVMPSADRQRYLPLVLLPRAAAHEGLRQYEEAAADYEGASDKPGPSASPISSKTASADWS
ncbi:hypothetical protein SAMN06265365_105125 [Tistlia consotensis]|uniref:Tetratricopeptide repeat-containing protein n=1 Tax=Tistlia consotensis USBA 355 TaxID=560819 RepID=A0A1Y6BIV6_9PROT|nr:hypothetical protein [Tistlia consotensis]SMF13548.1 hypothetical protein SAMN05428998_105173 [Tistlia consotensis USBA 355]SNR50398.1 hypothetical protein SAMN06265365_105125 [Tistlia consotensis]